MQKQIATVLNIETRKQYLANIVTDKIVNSANPPHLTASINLKKQRSKDYLLRLAAASNSLID